MNVFIVIFRYLNLIVLILGVFYIFKKYFLNSFFEKLTQEEAIEKNELERRDLLRIEIQEQRQRITIDQNQIHELKNKANSWTNFLSAKHAEKNKNRHTCFQKIEEKYQVQNVFMAQKKEEIARLLSALDHVEKDIKDQFKNPNIHSIWLNQLVENLPGEKK